MPAQNEDDGDRSPDDRRRRFLKYATLAALGGSGVAGAWVVTRPDTPSDPSPTPPESSTATDDDEPVDAVPERVTRYAPDLYFGALEKWYPTDPRQYVTETKDGSVVDGFTALDDYSAAANKKESPPAPMVFYNVVEATEGIDAIQYWFYSVFDQFTVNFHWHDWELLQVFVDRDTGSPLLLSASAHARGTPNNEFLGPNIRADRRPGILSEVGSHSSASELNQVVPSFERLPVDDRESDVTNDLLDVTRDLTAPFAYGLPRDEGGKLPFVMPELDGHSLHEHPALSLDREDLIAERVTVDAWHGLPRPPSDIPGRESGIVITHSDSPTDANATYTLESIERVREAIDDFVGPQLSFEFVIPSFVEDRLAGHITSVGIPWQQDRFSDPLDDVTDPTHRQRMDADPPSSLSDRVVGRVRYLDAGIDGALDRVPDGAREALESEITVSLYTLPVEVAVRMSSENPEATVTRDGVFGYLHVESGDHSLVVNGPGIAPLGLRFVHDGGLFQAGAGGELTVIANEDAGWIRGDGRASNGIARVRVIEDYAGVVYEGRPIEADRFAVAVHREGNYTVEIVDSNGRSGAYRVTPDSFGEESEAVRKNVKTGKASLSDTVADEIGALADLARTLIEDDPDSGEIITRLSRAQEAATTATTAAERGDADMANEWLFETVSFLQDALEILSSERQSVYGERSITVLEPRIREVIERTEAAIETELA